MWPYFQKTESTTRKASMHKQTHVTGTLVGPMKQWYDKLMSQLYMGTDTWGNVVDTVWGMHYLKGTTEEVCSDNLITVAHTIDQWKAIAKYFLTMSVWQIAPSEYLALKIWI